MRFDLENYVDVQERINRFWQEHPNGAIRTRLESLPDCFDICRYSAAVYKDVADPWPAATGYASEWREKEGRGPNVTSHEENCETSAIGRALANMGYAKNREERPSRQEMDKVNRLTPVEPERTGFYGQRPPFDFTRAGTKPTPLPAVERVNARPIRDEADMPPPGVSQKSWKFMCDLAERRQLTIQGVEGILRAVARGGPEWTLRDATPAGVSKMIDWLRTDMSTPFDVFAGAPLTDAERREVQGVKQETAPWTPVDDVIAEITRATHEQEVDAIAEQAFNEGLMVDQETSNAIAAAVERRKVHLREVRAPEPVAPARR